MQPLQPVDDIRFNGPVAHVVLFVEGMKVLHPCQAVMRKQLGRDPNPTPLFACFKQHQEATGSPVSQ